MEEFVDTLVYSISDVGSWSWWVANLPNSFQVEFSNTLLWNPPKSENSPPSGQIALRFIQPRHISFITRISEHSINDDWFTLLHNDKIQPFSIDYNAFSINNKDRAKEFLKEMKEYKKYFGDDYNEELFQSKYYLCFWAEQVGVLIFADDMEIYNHLGKIEFSEVVNRSKKWWEYWNDYYAKKDTEHKYPYDFTCEVTIPITKN